MLLNCAYVGLQQTPILLPHVPFFFLIKLKYYKDDTTTQSCTSENMGALQQDQVFWVLWENYQSPVTNAVKTAVSATPLLPELTSGVCRYGALRPLHEVKQSLILPIWHSLGGIKYVQ